MLCRKFHDLLTALVVIATVTLTFSARAENETLSAMQAELHRSFEALRNEPVAPYFISYEITDDSAFTVSASFGSVQSKNKTQIQHLDIDLRVGAYDLDNTRLLTSGGGFSYNPNRIVQIPIDNANALQHMLWYHTDLKYREAVSQLAKVRTEIQVRVMEKDASGDFSTAPKVQVVESIVPLDYDYETIARKLELYSKKFAEYPEILTMTAGLSGNVETRYYVNTEGSAIRVSQPAYTLLISAQTKADDGMNLPRSMYWNAFTLEGLPEDEAVLKAVDKMIDDLLTLRVAPIVDPYAGPAILSGMASGVFFHEILGHRLEGHRLKSADDSQTFKKKLGTSLLPASFSVVFDPTLTTYGNVDLIGHYRFDNEGVAARRVPVIENGVLKRFLMSRTPIPGFSQSNGHGRKNFGHAPVSRQSNLIVELSEDRSLEELKSMLIDLVKEAGKPFGLWFEDIQGGFTLTNRTLPNSFQVTPVVVYRVYPNGKEEMIRGVDLVGTPLTSFSSIVAGGGDPEVFNGICGAESGHILVSAVSPAILIHKVEVQKKEHSQERLPILPRPQATPPYLGTDNEGVVQ